MAKYKVLNKFKDLQANEVYKVGQEVEMTVKRADEIANNLKKYDREFLERIDNEEEDKKDKKKKEEEGK